MQATLENLGALERRLQLAVPVAALESEANARLKKVARTAKFSGFRPGKAPMSLVARQYGAEIRQEILGEQLQQRFEEAVREQALRVVGFPRFAAVAPEGDAPQTEVAFSATFEVFPEVTLASLSDKTLEKPSVELGDADVEKTLDVLRKQRASFEDVSRPAQMGDLAVIDYRGIHNGEAFEGGTAQDFPVVLGEGRLLADFEKAVEGLNVGESRDFPLTFPVDYHSKDLAGQEVTFTVTVKNVREPKLPALDDTFIKSLGVDSGSEADLRAEVKTNLGREVERRLKTQLKEAVMKLLADANEIELPKTLVEVEIDRLQEQAKHDFINRGFDKDLVPELPRALLEEQARVRVKLGLVLAEVVKQHHLTAKTEQVDAMIDEQAQSYEKPEDVVAWFHADPSRIEGIEALVLEDNVVAWVLSQVQVTPVVKSFDELMGKASS